jgi:biuret amidohydrolase
MVPTLGSAVTHARAVGMPVIYTQHIHRRDASDMGLLRETHPDVTAGLPLLEGTAGAELYPAVAPKPEDIVIRKCRFSAFYGTDLDIVLNGLGTRTVVLGGVTTETCVVATAHDARYRDLRVVGLADACATVDFPDLGWGALSADEMHRAALVSMARTTAHVMTVEEMMQRTTGVAA